MEVKKVHLSPPAGAAVTENQLRSLAELPKVKKYALYETLSVDNLEVFHKVSCRPITKKAEDDMELLSDILTWGERYLHFWQSGIYHCSQCQTPLYSSEDKYKGPCIWPSFRKPISENAVSVTTVYPYNNYTVEVKEVYCGKCDLFVGHQFEDAKQKEETLVNNDTDSEHIKSANRSTDKMEVEEQNDALCCMRVVNENYHHTISIATGNSGNNNGSVNTGNGIDKKRKSDVLSSNNNGKQ